MLSLLSRFTFLIAVGALTCACQKTPQVKSEASAKVQARKESAKEGLDQAGEKAKELGQEALDKTKEAGEKIQEGFANFTEDVKEKYPQVVESMQKQFDALKEGVEEKYEETIAENAPHRSQLLDEFRANAPLKKTYTLETFTVLSSTETETVAEVVLASKNSDPTQSPQDKHAKFRYIFRRASSAEMWRVYDIIPIDETAREAEEKEAGESSQSDDSKEEAAGGK